MRVLQILGSIDPALGGTVELVRSMSCALSALGHRVEVVVTTEGPHDVAVQHFPLRVHALGPSRGSYAFSARLTPWLRAQRDEYDVWIIHGLWQFPGLAASRNARRMGVPYVVYPHGMLDPRARPRPVKYAKKALYWCLFERTTLARARRVLFTNEAERRQAEHFMPWSRWTAYVVGNGIQRPAVDPGAIERARELYMGRDRRRPWLFLGRLHPGKGIEELLEAFARLDSADARLLIAGSGEDRYVEGLNRRADKLGLSHRVSFLGPVFGQAKWGLLAACELFILPSHHESFGIAVTEALAMGTPVCISRAVNIWDSVDAENAGIVCDDTMPGLQEALQRWLTMPIAERKSFGQRAQRCFDRHFEVNQAAKRLVSCLEGIVRPG